MFYNIVPWSNSQDLDSRAYRDGADEETIICALFHDVGELLTPACHGEVGKITLER